MERCPFVLIINGVAKASSAKFSFSHAPRYEVPDFLVASINELPALISLRIADSHNRSTESSPPRRGFLVMIDGRTWICVCNLLHIEKYCCFYCTAFFVLNNIEKIDPRWASFKWTLDQHNDFQSPCATDLYWPIAAIWSYQTKR